MFRILYFISFLLLAVINTNAKEVMHYRRYTTADGLLQNNATTFAQDKDGYIWIGTRSGLCRFDGHHFEPFHITADGKKIGWIRKIRIDGDGKTLVMKINNQKFVKFNPATRQLTPINGSLNLGDQRPPKDVLDYTAQGLLLHHNNQDFSISYSGKAAYEIFHCENFIDRQGNIWANFDNAVYQITFSETNHNIYNNVGDEAGTPFLADIRCITRLKDGTFVVGTKGKEIVRYDGNGKYLGCLNANGQWQGAHTVFIESAYNIQEDSHGRLWIGMRTAGLACIEKTANASQCMYVYNHNTMPELPSDQVFDIHLSEKTGWLWIGTWGNGIAIIDTRHASLRPDNIRTAMPKISHETSTRVRRICEIGDSMAVCTTNGIYLYDRHGRYLKHAGDMDVSGIVCMNGKTYIGAYSQGAFVMDSKGAIEPMDVPGLGDCIHAIAGSVNNQLIFTNPDRIVAYDTKRGSTRFFDNVFFGENVAFSEMQPLFINNKIITGLTSGILEMPLTAPKSTYLPTIHIPQARTILGIGETMKVKPTIIDFRIPRMVSYAWREKGDSLWHYMTGEMDEVEVSWFMPGVHTLEFCSTEATGAWTENVTEADFYVAPSWWQWLIILIITAFIIVIIYLAYKVTHPTLIATSDTTVDTATDIFPSAPDVTPYDKELAQKLVDNIEKEISNPDYSVDQLALDMGMSRSQLYSHCKDTLDKTPAAFILEIRMKRAMQLIETRQLRVSEIAYMVGFTDPKYFAKVFKKRVGMSPTQYAGKE